MSKFPTIVIWIALGFIGYEILKKYFGGDLDIPATPVTLGTPNPVPASSSTPSLFQALSAAPAPVNIITPGSGYVGAGGVVVTAPTYTGFGGSL